MLVVGASGLVGSNLVEAARDEWEVFGTYWKHRVDFEGVEELQLDVRDYQQVSALVKAVSPEVVVHASALMDVDACERDRVAADELNRMGTRHVVRAAGRDALVVYLSTDYVFDGRKGAPYVETDAPGPLNVYGQSKLEGEEEVRAHAGQFLIVRPAQIWGANRMTKKPTLVQKVRDGLRSGREVELLDDQVQSPTFAPELAKDILALVGAGERGVFHAAGPTPATRLDFGRAVAEAYGLDPERLRGVHLADAAMGAPRPVRVPLSRAKADGATGRTAPSLRESLRQFATADGVANPL